MQSQRRTGGNFLVRGLKWQDQLYKFHGTLTSVKGAKLRKALDGRVGGVNEMVSSQPLAGGYLYSGRFGHRVQRGSRRRHAGQGTAPAAGTRLRRLAL